MIEALSLLVVLAQTPVIRDEYGVPHIRAKSWEHAFVMAGYAVAQDRLWQMEMSRRIARGRLAEVMGAAFVASDKEIAQFGYTDAELASQVQKLSPQGRIAFAAYARGVSSYIVDAQNTKSLPAGYAKNGFEPEPWTVIDSAAISVRLLQQFGRGGAGEIRNMALLGYLQTQAKLKGRELDVLDDFAWAQDRNAICTIAPVDEDDRQPAPFLPVASRDQTVQHLAKLPKLSLFELLPGIRVAERSETTKVAEQLGAPFKAGSYCVVVGKDRSATGKPILMNGPQMGWQNPSIVHEMSIATSDFSTTGMDVPGVPGILVGHTPNLAWGLTSGVADTEDIVFYRSDDDATYRYGSEVRKFEVISRTIKVKDSDSIVVVQRRTTDGPVVLSSRGAGVVFARRSAFYKREIESHDTMNALVTAVTHGDVATSVQHSTVNFNFFYALRTGDIGYRFIARMPIRRPGLDARFPMPGGPQSEWVGEIPFDLMPHIVNPKAGYLANWNNKPVSWWPNGDTPTWGRAFRNQSLLAALPIRKLTAQDLERAAWTIARMDENAHFLVPLMARAAARHPNALALGFDGSLLDGSTGAAVYLRFVNNMRQSVFQPMTGAFMTPDNFRQIAQVSVLLNAIEGKTKINYLAGRKLDDILDDCLARAMAEVDTTPPLRYTAPGMRIDGEAPIPYSNRGTYLQVVEFFERGISGRNIVSPGVAETGPHSKDQVPLARAWLFKAMGF